MDPNNGPTGLPEYLASGLMWFTEELERRMEHLNSRHQIVLADVGMLSLLEHILTQYTPLSELSRDDRIRNINGVFLSLVEVTIHSRRKQLDGRRLVRSIIMRWGIQLCATMKVGADWPTEITNCLEWLVAPENSGIELPESPALLERQMRRWQQNQWVFQFRRGALCVELRRLPQYRQADDDDSVELTRIGISPEELLELNFIPLKSFGGFEQSVLHHFCEIWRHRVMRGFDSGDQAHFTMELFCLWQKIGISDLLAPPDESDRTSDQHLSREPDRDSPSPLESKE